MAQLTIKEKEHWKERISRKVDQAIDDLLVSTDADYLGRLAIQAERMALEALGIRELEDQLAEVEKQKHENDRKREKTIRMMIHRITGCPVDELSRCYYNKPSEVNDAIRKRKERFEAELLEKDELGRQILALRREKEELLDTVWLATSGKQIRQLWSVVNDVLKQSPTQFQIESLMTEPAPDTE